VLSKSRAALSAPPPWQPVALSRNFALASAARPPGLDCDLVVVPVHQARRAALRPACGMRAPADGCARAQDVHWVLGVIDLWQHEIRYYDSLGGVDQSCLVRAGFRVRSLLCCGNADPCRVLRARRTSRATLRTRRSTSAKRRWTCLPGRSSRRATSRSRRTAATAACSCSNTRTGWCAHPGKRQLAALRAWRSRGAYCTARGRRGRRTFLSRSATWRTSASASWQRCAARRSQASVCGMC
jgi:hypothetical protein